MLVVGGSGAEGTQALLSPLELTEQPPAFPLKPSAVGELNPHGPLSRPLNKLSCSTHTHSRMWGGRVCIDGGFEQKNVKNI